jgi:hypothetical protein
MKPAPEISTIDRGEVILLLTRAEQMAAELDVADRSIAAMAAARVASNLRS